MTKKLPSLLGALIALGFHSVYADANAKAALEEAGNWTASTLLGTGTGIYGNALPFSFVYGGKTSSELLKTGTLARASRVLDDARTEQTITWADPATGLELRCVAVQYSDYPVVEWTLRFKNKGNSDTPILENIRAIDTLFPRGNHPFNLLHYSEGGFNGANAYQPKEVALEGENGGLQDFNPGYGRGSDRYLPYFNLEYGNGGVILAMGWPGQWSLEFKDQQVAGGQQLVHLILHPGEEIRSPLIALLFWRGGDWIDAQNVWRRWMIAHSTPSNNGKPLDPIFCAAGQILGETEKDMKSYLDGYLKAGLKPDYAWIDAGWYPHKKNWEDTLGTWEPDPTRFPNGLRSFSDYCHANSVKLIVWFEPERVTPGSWIWDYHPEWLLSKNDRNRLLDLGNPEALHWLTDYIDKFITKQGVDLYRQDHNFNPLAYWRENDAPDRKGLTENRHVQGYLAYWDALLQRHPGMLIDSCAAGGRRNDLETLRRSVVLWRNDYGNEPLGEQGESYGFAFWAPYQSSGVGVADPYAVRSAILWDFGSGYDFRKSGNHDGSFPRQVRQWREFAPCYLGDYYPLTPFSLSENAWLAWQYNRPEQGDGIVQAFRRAGCADALNRFRLRGLDPAAVYRLTDIDTSQTQDLTGMQLMEEGLPTTIPANPGASVVRYLRVPKP